MEYKKETIGCIICGHDKFQLVWDKQLRKNLNRLTSKYNIIDNEVLVHGKIVICEKCGLIFTNPQMSGETLDKFYNEEYRKIFPISASSKQPDIHAYTAMHTINALQKLVGDFSSFLDVGCGPKKLVDKLTKQGKAARGYDKDLGIPGIYHNMDEIQKKFDCVTCFNTLEHVKNPISFLADLKKFVGKCLIVGVPDVYGKMNCTVDAFFSCAHLWHFSHETLTNVCKLAGYNIWQTLRYVNEPMCEKLHIILSPAETKDIIKPEITKPAIRTVQDLFLITEMYQSQFYKDKWSYKINDSIEPEI